MEKYLCPGCMREFVSGAVKCPHCGYIRGEKQPPYTLPLGTRLHGGKYLLGKQQGRGGFGITYVAHDTNLNRRVAVKEFYNKDGASRQGTEVIWETTELLTPKEDLEGFRKEARKLSKLDDIPGIVRVYDVFDENNTVYMVMNFIEGETLQSRIVRAGAMSWDECYRLLRPLMESLAEVHRHQIIHRDISPDNIIINSQGRAILVDFGIAKDLNPNRTVSVFHSRPAAKKGYSPPEQYELDYNARKFGPWTDVYALCATVFVCLTCKSLPDGRTRRDYPQMRSFPDGIRLDPKLEAILQKGLSVNPRDRYQNMEQLIAALDQTVQSYEPLKSQPFWKREKGYQKQAKQPAISLKAPNQRKNMKTFSKSTLMQKMESIIALFLIFVWTFPWVDRTLNLGIMDYIDVQSASFMLKEGATASGLSWSLENNILKISDPVENNVLKTFASGLMDDFSPGGSDWYRYRELIYSVSISDSVRSIGNNAFYDCNNLKSVIIPDSVTSIGDHAFENCSSLKSVTIPDSVTSIGMSAFSGCTNLKSVTIPDSVTSIGSYAFRHCNNLASVSIGPATAYEMGSTLISSFDNTTEVIVRESANSILNKLVR